MCLGVVAFFADPFDFYRPDNLEFLWASRDFPPTAAGLPGASLPAVKVSHDDQCPRCQWRLAARRSAAHAFWLLVA